MKYHQILAKYFDEQPLYLDVAEKKPNTRKLVELPWQQTKAEMWDEINITLCDHLFISTKLKFFSLHSLVEDYDFLENRSGSFLNKSTSISFGRILRFCLRAYYPKTVEDEEILFNEYKDEVKLNQEDFTEAVIDLCYTAYQSLQDWNSAYGIVEILTKIYSVVVKREFFTSHLISTLQKEIVPIYLFGIFIDKYPVTVKELEEAYSLYKSPWRGLGDSIPATGISWAEANVFALRRGMRIPSVQEWLAAGGVYLDGRQFPWGNEEEKGFCNCSENSIGHPTPVNYFDPNGESPYTVSDLMGNVWEFTATEFPHLNKAHVIYNLEQANFIGNLFNGSLRTRLLHSGNATILGGDYKLPILTGGLDGFGIRKRDICLDLAGNFNIGFRCVRDFADSEIQKYESEILHECSQYLKTNSLIRFSLNGVICNRCSKSALISETRVLYTKKTSPIIVCFKCLTETLKEFAKSDPAENEIYFGHSISAAWCLIRKIKFHESPWAKKTTVNRWENIIE